MPNVFKIDFKIIYLIFLISYVIIVYVNFDILYNATEYIIYKKAFNQIKSFKFQVRKFGCTKDKFAPSRL